MTRPHDSAYKLLFSEPQIVIDLLQGFVHESWVKELDFNTLEKVSGSYISDDLRSREDDVIWRVKYQQSWIYVYLLLEFQSTIDRYMAVRLMTYIGLLYQDLIKTKQLLPNKLLPPVCPIVLYNGDKRWTATTELKDLIVKVPGGLEKFLPSLSYLLLDEGAYTTEELAPLKNLVAAIFRLENARSPEDFIRVISNIMEWLATPEQTQLRRSFIVWINRVMVSEHGFEHPITDFDNLTEMKTMLTQRVSEWTREWKQQGWTEGLEQGMEKIVRQLLITLSTEQVAKLTDLPLEKIVEIKNKTQH